MGSWFEHKSRNLIEWIPSNFWICNVLNILILNLCQLHFSLSRYSFALYLWLSFSPLNVASTFLFKYIIGLLKEKRDPSLISFYSLERFCPFKTISKILFCIKIKGNVKREEPKFSNLHKNNFQPWYSDLTMLIN